MNRKCIDWVYMHRNALFVLVMGMNAAVRVMTVFMLGHGYHEVNPFVNVPEFLNYSPLYHAYEFFTVWGLIYGVLFFIPWLLKPRVEMKNYREGVAITLLFFLVFVGVDFGNDAFFMVSYLLGR